jgi:hypothetical protein
VGTKKLAWGEAIRLYTRGELNGSAKNNPENVKGNWLDWHKAEESHWPLTPGEYDVKLMLDDGFHRVDSHKAQGGTLTLIQWPADRVYCHTHRKS